MKKLRTKLFLLAFFVMSVHAASATECLTCHQSNVSSFPLINESLFGVHRNVNTTDGIGNLTSADCMTCHYSANILNIPHSFPVLTHTCDDCHSGGTFPSPKVYNHDHTGNITVNFTCSTCHNKTSNLFRYSENASASHYGRNASFNISPGEPYCAYCHENSSSIYKDAMQNPDNSMRGNHTSGIINPDHPAGRPDCTTCHGTDRIHGTNLTKPTPDSVFCKNCHDKDTIKKDKHAGYVECIRCHADKNSDIHNIKYLLQNGTYQGINATGCGDCHGTPFIPIKPQLPTADCTTCHLGNGLTKFAEAPHLPSPMNHSSNPNSGRLWNGSQPAYWNSQINACRYCHGDKLHDINPLGNVSNIAAGNYINQSITNTSYWCANCHYGGNNSSGNYLYNGTSLNPIPPEIQNKFGLVPARASDGTNFHNHSFDRYSDDMCITCHSSSPNFQTGADSFVHNVSIGAGGPDCISCHDINGGTAPLDKRIDISIFNKSVHFGVNGGGNGACWACHGNGTQPIGHPSGYKSPKKCSNDECHSIYQKFRAPMIYSHFKNASLNDNPTNAANYNVTTSVDCQDCHVNSVNSYGMNINSTVSHFASRDLFDTINCMYCHMDKDNSKKWGNAPLVYKNTTTLVKLDREDNKFTVNENGSMDLGSNFRLKILEISSVRESALVELIKDNISVDKRLIGIGNYTYEEYVTIDNGSTQVPVIVLNVTSIFKGNATSFIKFEGFRLNRAHLENKLESCLACHMHASPETTYKVLERVNSSDRDKIFYIKEIANFTDKKIYNETIAYDLLNGTTSKDQHIDLQPEKTKSLYESEIWHISEDTALTVKGVDSKSEAVFLSLQTGDYSYESVVNRGGLFEFNATINYLGNQPKNISIFRARVSGIVQGNPRNMVILDNVTAFSPDIKNITSNKTIEGYNASWLWENSTINIGKIPDNFHSPQVFDGTNGGGNCVSCHGKEGFSGKKVLALGIHEMINGGGNNSCRACHGGKEDIKSHPVGYKTPKKCLSCHTTIVDNYGATYIGDEEHRYGQCETCHVLNTHEIIELHMVPIVKNVSISRNDSMITLNASAIAGYKMKVRDARYYIDSSQEKFKMYPVDGVFDSNEEEISAKINVSGLSVGKHTVYVEAMERDNNWGDPASLDFTVNGVTVPNNVNLKSNLTIMLGTFTLTFTAIALFVAFVLNRRSKKRKQ
jgi:glutaredoxin